MKALREAKAKERVKSTENSDLGATATANDAEVSASAPEDIQGESELDQLKRHVQELSSVIANLQKQAPQGAQGPQVTSRGIVGTFVKYSLNPKDYPTREVIFEKLLQEPKLTIQGFTRDWWDIEWEISQVNYDTKDGIHTSEPKFQVRLIRIVPDEEGMPSAKRYVLHKLSFFEDPVAAMQVAAQYGLAVSDELEKTFLDEMRYLRIRDWVLESFYPPKPTQAKMNKTETVIGNRLVEVYEINSTETESIPFNQMTKKL